MNTLIASLVTDITNSIDLTQKALDFSAGGLDGTPFLFTLIEADGNVRVFGEWHGVRGFASARTIPAHLCGAYCCDRASINRKIVALTPSLKAGERCHFIHRRDFLLQRLEDEKALLATLTQATA